MKTDILLGVTFATGVVIGIMIERVREMKKKPKLVESKPVEPVPDIPRMERPVKPWDGVSMLDCMAFDTICTIQSPPEDAPVKPPYMITYDEMMYDFPEVDQVTLEYWQKDKVLAEDDDILIDEKERLLGECLKYIEDTSDNTCYVRNEELDINYEVVIYHSSYHEDVLGE